METIYLEECPEGLYIEQRGRGGKGRTTEKLKSEIEEDLIVEVQRLRAENAYIKINALVADLSHNTYYYYTKKHKDPDKSAELKEKICSIVAEKKGKYGCRRVTLELCSRDFHYDHKFVMKFMKKIGLSSEEKVPLLQCRGWKEVSAQRSQIRNGAPMVPNSSCLMRRCIFRLSLIHVART